MRKLVNIAFMPRMLRGMIPRMESLVNRLLDETSQSSEPDFVETFCLPLPTGYRNTFSAHKNV